jgi:hypothetical protein
MSSFFLHRPNRNGPGRKSADRMRKAQTPLDIAVAMWKGAEMTGLIVDLYHGRFSPDPEYSSSPRLSFKYDKRADTPRSVRADSR